MFWQPICSSQARPIQWLAVDKVIGKECRDEGMGDPGKIRPSGAPTITDQEQQGTIDGYWMMV